MDEIDRTPTIEEPTDPIQPILRRRRCHLAATPLPTNDATINEPTTASQWPAASE